MGFDSSRIIPFLLAAGVTCFIGFPMPMLPQASLAPVLQMPVPGSQPAVCVAYNGPDNYGEQWGMCPKGYASYAVADAGGREREGTKIPAVQTCCPLPAPDILTNEEVMVTESCPEDYVATGSKLDFSKGDDSIQYMRCTKINSSRYQLGTVSSSLYWGNGFSGWQGGGRIERSLIPAGLRPAIGRQTKERWGHEGCVGYPFGSLLTSKKAKVCKGFKFRQLEFKGIAGDPPAGTPVQMFADCDHVSDMFSAAQTSCHKG